MAGTLKRLAGPVAMSNTYGTDIYVPPSALKYSVIRHIHIANKAGATRTFRLFLGATGGTAAGTELFYDVSIASNDYFDWFGALKVTSTDFLSGGADAAAGLTITVMGEEFVVPS